MNPSDSNPVSSPVKIRKILVPVDYSECSRFACRYAIKIACKLGVEIKLFHTYYSPAFDLIELAGAVQTQSQLREEVTVNLEESEKETLINFMNGLKDYIEQCNLPPVQMSFDLAPGVPEDEIINYSKEYLPDLVIMGTRGKGTGVGAIIGSVTASVITRMKMPVLAIPEKYTFVGEENVKNLMYVTDFDESDFLTLKSLINLTDQLGLDIHCVHIGDPDSWDRVKMEGLMKYFTEVYGKTQVSYSFVSQKNLLPDLDELIRQKSINILSLTAHRQGIVDRLFKRNMTKKLFYHTSIPLLVFH
ncbi:MAG TPA: universal stress protein [Bacteroidales bacterium]|nr:universal stress protein [Bacteroidales bacterium]